MGEVVDLDIPTLGPIPPEKILGGALEGNLSEAMVLGYDQDDEFYFSSSTGNIADMLLLLERAKQLLMDQASE